ncbi:MAG TPA: DSD1 family PLP-dependent enzyme [Symbiobacteriaceae bacterium]|nr:DSD1 family PLP-dependent enzyme [Symbiobacteriaceae bacterium]
MSRPGVPSTLPAVPAHGRRIHKQELETPALIVDLDILEHNIAAMAAAARAGGVTLRPHIKTHKTPAIAHKQMAAGAVGICCATLGEAEVMVAAGLPDILITRAVVGPSKVARLCALARQSRLAVVTDSVENVDELAAAAQSLGVVLDVLMEVNVGQNRCGVEPASAQALTVARRIAGHKSLRFGGLQGYEGHLVLIPEEGKRTGLTRSANAAGLETKSMLERDGIAVPILTGGGTGTYLVTGEGIRSGYTEIQPGTYPTMDARYSAQMGDEPFGPALSLLATCVSRAPGRAVLDAGTKAISVDYGAPPIKGRPGLAYQPGGGGDEHGLLFCQDDELKVGERVELYPSHGCTTFNLHNWLYGIRGDYVEVVWQVAARGCFW